MAHLSPAPSRQEMEALLKEAISVDVVPLGRTFTYEVDFGKAADILVSRLAKPKKDGLMSWREFALLAYDDASDRVPVCRHFCGRGDGQKDGESYIIAQQQIENNRVVIILNLKNKSSLLFTRQQASTLESFEKELFYFFVAESMEPYLELQPDTTPKDSPAIPERNCLRDDDKAYELVGFDSFVQYASRNIFEEGRIDFHADNTMAWHQMVGLTIEGTKMAFCAAHDGRSKLFSFKYSETTSEELNQAALAVALTEYLEKDECACGISVMPALARKMGSPSAVASPGMSEDEFLAHLANHYKVDKQLLDIAGNILRYAEGFEDDDDQLDFLCDMFSGVTGLNGITAAELSEIHFD